MQVIDITTDQIAIQNLTVAEPLVAVPGLMGLPLRAWLRHTTQPCTSVHTMFMRVPIDIYFLDESNVIVDRRPSLTMADCDPQDEMLCRAGSSDTDQT